MSGSKDMTFMRECLARAGITLDEPVTVTSTKAALQRAAENAPPAVDREQVRAILRERGAPERSLAWLTASCPSLEYAQSYTPAPETHGLRCFDGRRGEFERDTGRCKLCRMLAWQHSSTRAA